MVGITIAAIGMFGIVCWVVLQMTVVEKLQWKEDQDTTKVTKTVGELNVLRARFMASGVFGFSVLLLVLSLVVMWVEGIVRG